MSRPDVKVFYFYSLLPSFSSLHFCLSLRVPLSGRVGWSTCVSGRSFLSHFSTEDITQGLIGVKSVIRNDSEELNVCFLIYNYVSDDVKPSQRVIK